MIIVITDACFLIDLIDIDLFEEFLGLGYQVHITSSVFTELESNEYVTPVSKSIQRKNMFIYNMTAADQTALENLMGQHSSRLSEPDCSCLYLAKEMKATILTCEKLLTNVAKNLNLDVHGSLWILDSDYADLQVPMLLRMFERRKTGYRGIGYGIVER